ncbi:MAG TPA: NAD-dependent succinate-semialdehyde dehydrogenase [Rudaea sp.]|uniref:NAD-dependent succinate-semialdehyde dehydrogenase n=1 Tax=Rudaea sp. TaxID=2136325 RepID=UPI002F93A0A3
MNELPKLGKHPKQLIDGAWRAGRGNTVTEIVNPATGAVFAAYQAPAKGDLDEALDSARRAFPRWRAVPAYNRGQILRRAAALMRDRIAEIGSVLTQEEGKPLIEAKSEVQITADMFDWFAEEGVRAYGRIVPARAANLQQQVLREPVGPTAAFAAWNFPARNPGYKIAASLAAGCPILVKPAEETPLTCLLLVQTLIDAGLPTGVVNVVYGDAPAISEHLIASDVVRKISLTGSTRVGQILARLAADGTKKLTLELGGQAPVLIFNDADLQLAIKLLVGAKFRNAGQTCISPTRFFVQENVYEAFIAGFAEAAQALKLGDGLAPDTTMGPLVRRRRVADLAAFIDDARARHARIIGSENTSDARGAFVAPTVVADLDDNAKLMRDEPFGPVAAIASFTTLDEAVARANRLPYGLAAYVFTRSLHTAHVVAESIEAGMIGINTCKISYPETPFGGVKASGYGSEGAIEGLDAYLVTKSVSLAY